MQVASAGSSTSLAKKGAKAERKKRMRSKDQGRFSKVKHDGPIFDLNGDCLDEEAAGIDLDDLDEEAVDLDAAASAQKSRRRKQRNQVLRSRRQADLSSSCDRVMCTSVAGFALGLCGVLLALSYFSSAGDENAQPFTAGDVAGAATVPTSIVAAPHSTVRTAQPPAQVKYVQQAHTRPMQPTQPSPSEHTQPSQPSQPPRLSQRMPKPVQPIQTTQQSQLATEHGMPAQQVQPGQPQPPRVQSVQQAQTPQRQAAVPSTDRAPASISPSPSLSPSPSPPPLLSPLPPSPLPPLAYSPPLTPSPLPPSTSRKAAKKAAKVAAAAAAALAEVDTLACTVRPCICLTALTAAHVKGRDEGSYGTSDPVLWIYEGQGNFESLQKTSVAMNDLNPGDRSVGPEPTTSTRSLSSNYRQRHICAPRHA